MAERSILLVLGPSTGGIGTHVTALVEDYVSAGAAVTVCAPAATLQLFGLADKGARAVAMPVALGLLLRVRRCSSLRRLAAAHDLTHAHGLQPGAVACLVTDPRRLVVTWHNAPLARGLRLRLHELLERLTARRAAVTVGASPDLVVRARAAGARDARFIPVAPPALRPAGDLSSLRAELASGDSPIVLAIGRLHAQKRFEVLLQAAVSWQHRHPRPVVVIAGDGPARDQLQQQASRTGVALRLLGRRSDIADLLALARVVVLPSEWEARPLVAQEALAAGRALVATRVGGVPELVGAAALLVPVGDPAALSAAVETLLDDDVQRTRLEHAALERAATWPGTHEVSQLLLALYDEITGSR